MGLDDITDYTEPVPIMGTPVGYDTVTFEDIGAILRKYHIEDKLPPMWPGTCWTMTRRRKRPRP